MWNITEPVNRTDQGARVILHADLEGSKSAVPFRFDNSIFDWSGGIDVVDTGLHRTINDWLVNALGHPIGDNGKGKEKKA